jgi:hypothetical protein
MNRRGVLECLNAEQANPSVDIIQKFAPPQLISH